MKTHEECQDSNCQKAEISAYVCRIFGIPKRKSRRKN